MLKITLVLFFINLNWASAQTNPVGKSYTALMNTTCKLFEDGGCTIETYCTISFEKKLATISYSAKASCSPEDREKFYEDAVKNNTKSYAWSRQGNMINIENFNDLENITFSENSIIGRKKESNKAEPIIFTESTK